MGWRKVLVGLAIVVAVGGVGATIATVVVYHQTTKIDRSEPLAVLDEYLAAALVSKDKVGAELYSCSDTSELEPLARFRAELDQRERDFGVEMIVSWGALLRTDANGSVEIATELTTTATSQGQVQGRQTEPWRFTLHDEDGWRVCKAELLPRPSPTPSPSL